MSAQAKIAPEVLPPAFYPVGLNLAGRRCVVIGAPDDREAIEKTGELRAVGADVTWLHDPAAVAEGDVADAFFVISTPQDAALAQRLRVWADRHRFLLCAIDQPALGFVALQATVASGPARIAISTGGLAPRVGGTIRVALQRALDERFARFLACLGHQRRLVKEAQPGPGGAPARRAAMIAAAEGFTCEVRVTYPAWFVDELAQLGPTVLSE